MCLYFEQKAIQKGESTSQIYLKFAISQEIHSKSLSVNVNMRLK